MNEEGRQKLKDQKEVKNKDDKEIFFPSVEQQHTEVKKIR